MSAYLSFTESRGWSRAQETFWRMLSFQPERLLIAAQSPRSILIATKEPIRPQIEIMLTRAMKKKLVPLSSARWSRTGKCTAAPFSRVKSFLKLTRVTPLVRPHVQVTISFSISSSVKHTSLFQPEDRSPEHTVWPGRYLAGLISN